MAIAIVICRVSRTQETVHLGPPVDRKWFATYGVPTYYLGLWNGAPLCHDALDASVA